MTLPTIQFHSDDFSLRIDKNVAFNILSFRDLGDDAKIIKALLIYTALNHQEEDLFGFYRLDPKKFADTMSLQESHLYRLHPNPYFLTHDPKAQEKLQREEDAPKGRMSQWRTWRTYLENALYILTNQSIVDDYRFKDETKTIITTSRFNFFDEITFKLEKTGKTYRVIYYYKPNKKYEDNLKQYFLLGEIKKYNELKKPNLEDAYLDLLNRIGNANAKNINSILFSIDTLSSILGLKKYSRFSDQKRAVTKKFNKLCTVIGKDIKGLQLTWVNPNDNIGDYIGKVQHGVKVKVNNVAMISWDRITAEEKRKKDSKNFKNIFDTELTRAFIQAFFNKYSGKLAGLSEDRKKQLFYEWFFSDVDMDIKEIKYENTYLDIYKNSKGMGAHSREFFKVVAYSIKIQEKYNCISFENDRLKLYLKDKKITFRHLYQLLERLEEMTK